MKKNKIFEIIGAVTAVLTILLAIYQTFYGGEQDSSKVDSSEQIARSLDKLVVILGEINSKPEIISKPIEYKTNEQISDKTLDSKEMNEVESAITNADENLSHTNKTSNENHTVDQQTESKIQIEEIPKTQSEAIGQVGWIYVGNFDKKSKQWNTKDYNKTIKGFKNNNLSEEDVIIIEKNVGFNSNQPSFPLYEKGLERIFPFTLNSGTKVKVIAVKDNIGLRKFTWAKVKIISIP